MKKRFALMLFTLTLFSLCSLAHAADSADDFASQMAERLKSQLSLSDEQASQIQSIFENYKPKRETESEAVTRMQNIQNEISSILTDDQKQLQAEQIGSGHFGQREGRGSGQGEGGPRGQLTEEQRKEMNEKWESLTDEQKAEMKARREEMQERRGSVQGEGGPRGQLTEEQRQERKEKHENFLSTLTDEQKAEFKERHDQMRKNHGNRPGGPRGR